MTNASEPQLDEAMWNVWLQKTKTRELRTIRRMNIYGGVALIIAAMAGAIYRFA